MVKSFALLSFVGAVVLGSVSGAPIRIPREAAPAPAPAVEQPPQSLGRRFPQALAADTPGLKAREPVAPIVPTTEEVAARRFPRRVYYEYYAAKREPTPAPAVDPHAVHYEVAREPELVRPAVEARAPTPEELAKSALDARNNKRASRRSANSDLYKRTLAKEGVKRRSPSEVPRSVKRSLQEAEEKRAYEEFKAKREPVVAPVVEKREPTPAPAPAVVEEPKLDARALDALDTVIQESRAFVPPEPASHAAARRDSYTWNIHAGDDLLVEINAPCASSSCPKKGKGKGCSGSGSASTPTGTNSPCTSPTSTPTGVKPPTDGSTSTSTSTSSASQSTETGSNPANAPPGGAQIPPPGGADTGSTTSTATSTKTSSSSGPTGLPTSCKECTTGAKTGTKTGTTDNKKQGDQPPTVTDSSTSSPSGQPQENHRRLEVKDTVLVRRESPKWTRMMPPAPETPQVKRSVFRREYH